MVANINLYNYKEYATTFRCAETTAIRKIGEIRKYFFEKGMTLNLPKGIVSDYMIYLFDETMLDCETVAEIKKANALEEMALAIKEKPLVRASDLERLKDTLEKI